MILVLAGNALQFADWLRLKPPNQKLAYRYGASVREFVGYKFDKIEIIGSFWLRPDANVLWTKAQERLKKR